MQSPPMQHLQPTSLSLSLRLSKSTPGAGPESTPEPQGKPTLRQHLTLNRTLILNRSCTAKPNQLSNLSSEATSERLG